MTDGKVDFELVSPERLLASKPVDMVVVPGGDGDFGVLPGHAPLLSTVLLVATGWTAASWPLAAACALIVGGGLVAARDLWRRAA